MTQCKNPHILIVDDEPNMRSLLQEIICDAGYLCDVSENGEHALRMLDDKSYNLIITDVKMPRMHGMDLLNAVKKIDKHCAVLVITAFVTVKQAVEAIKAGAEDYLTKPFDPAELLALIETIFRRQGMGKTELLNDPLTAIIGEGKNIQEVKRLIRAVAPTNSTVLIEGESGTGKELVANAVYYYSKRREQPFIKVNCAAIPAPLMESELFGHVKGSFTGAYKDKPGKFELADKGTIYLDEIGDMELSLQAKILRVLQEKELSRVGSDIEKKVDVRIIAATNKNLMEEIENRKFRPDLFYRLNVINIKMPLLVERKKDLPLLVKFFLEKYNMILGKNIKGISDKVLEILLDHRWPGNIRELQNIIEHCVVFASSDTIHIQDLPEHLFVSNQTVLHDDSSFKNAKDEYEKHLLEDALTKSRGKITEAARLLGISRHSLRYKMEKFGVTKTIS